MLAIGALFSFLAVALGAFGAHALRAKKTPDQLAVFQTGVQYQMFHALALVSLGMVSYISGLSMGSFITAGWFFIVGIVLFSGSLYALTLSSVKKLGIITPFGGVSFLIGWVFVFLGALHG